MASSVFANRARFAKKVEQNREEKSVKDDVVMFEPSVIPNIRSANSPSLSVESALLSSAFQRSEIPICLVDRSSCGLVACSAGMLDVLSDKRVTPEGSPSNSSKPPGFASIPLRSWSSTPESTQAALQDVRAGKSVVISVPLITASHVATSVSSNSNSAPAARRTRKRGHLLSGDADTSSAIMTFTACVVRSHGSEYILLIGRTELSGRIHDADSGLPDVRTKSCSVDAVPDSEKPYSPSFTTMGGGGGGGANNSNHNHRQTNHNLGVGGSLHPSTDSGDSSPLSPSPLLFLPNNRNAPHKASAERQATELVQYLCEAAALLSTDGSLVAISMRLHELLVEKSKPEPLILPELGHTLLRMTKATPYIVTLEISKRIFYLWLFDDDALAGYVPAHVSHDAVVVAAAKMQLEGGNDEEKESWDLASVGFVPLSAEQRMECGGLDQWDFDSLSIPRSREVLCAVMFEVASADVSAFLQPAPFAALIATVYDNYHDNPYHNFAHALDVTQAVCLLLNQLEPIAHWTPLERAGAVLAAICHDVDHPGTNNYCLDEMEDPLIFVHGSAGVLERHHMAIACRLLFSPTVIPSLWKSPTTRATRSEMRKVICRMILATDMGRHAEFYSQLKLRVEAFRASSPGRLQPIVLEGDDRFFLLECIVKSADMINILRPWKRQEDWGSSIQNECFHVGDLLAELHEQPAVVPPMFSRSVGPNLIDYQLGFINAVVLPFVQTLSEWIPGFSMQLESTRVTQRYWLEKKEANKA